MRSTQFFGRLLIALATMSVSASTVSADWNDFEQGWNDFWHRVGVGYHRNNAWPEPFNEADAISVITPFETMKRNGWVLHNTIGPHQFREGDGVLKPSGQEAVAWIAREAPPTRRHIYVVRAATEGETQARLDSVRDVLAQVRQSGPTPPISLIDRVPPSAPGSWATKVNRAWLEQLAPPKLPSSSAAGTASATRN